MTRHLTIALLAAATLLPLPAAAQTGGDIGVLVMAHGGSEKWNAGIRAAVEQFRVPYPVELAFGMADRSTLADSIAALAELDVERVVVIRLFVSGESFRPQTEYLLGLSAEAPHHLMDSGRDSEHEPILPIEHAMEIVLSDQGLAQSTAVGRILAERAAALSTDPSSETVLLVAHGMGAEDANDRLLAALDQRADQVRATAPYAAVHVETLREDWTGKRQEAEARIRAIVERAPGSTLVVPMRLHGFGPYAEVLEGLEYTADGRGLLPHSLVVDWMREQLWTTLCGRSWLAPEDCDTSID